VRGNSEQMSGGPFYRSLLNQGTDVDQQITYIVNYDMAQTEPYRVGALNTYALVFTDGATPKPIDTSWYGNLDLKGWTGPEGRGGVWGTGVRSDEDGHRPAGPMGWGPRHDGRSRYTVALSNATAQYYTTPDRSGTFRCEGMLPGSYTLSVFKNELMVGSRPVTVTAGGTTAAGAVTMTDPSATPALWRIGEWDGSPQELRNGGLLTTMHPSDVRMASWTPGPFTVGSSTNADFPAYQWKAINNGQVIRFHLTADQLKASQIRIGTTTAQNGARPTIKVNNWSSSAPAAPNQPKTRSLTVGTYRGNNTLYTFNVPASALVEGDNVMTITLISGTVADAWLSPAVSYDAIDLLQ
jgi:rhamnogalacturonan endolyase